VQGGGAAVGRLLAARELDVLALEAPPGVYAFPRGGAQTVIHLVNTSERPDGRGPQSYGHVTVGLRHPERWGSLRGATWYAPGRPAVAIDPEVHPDLVRLTVPSLATWGILRLEP
ncbi:MAG: hypothetical protein HUU35_16165, partial [Armatimonadetes bacterium]|nr:hypothetical protein [Armatimonadota bacterium]